MDKHWYIGTKKHDINITLSWSKHNWCGWGIEKTKHGFQIHLGKCHFHYDNYRHEQVSVKPIEVKTKTLEETLEFVNNPVLNLDGEVWKEHPIYHGYYGSNYGRIKNGMTEKHTSYDGVPVVHKVKPRIKVQHKKNKVEDTLMITIDRGFHDRHYVYCSRFVCECFNGLSDMVCAHKNNILYDNRIENLSWEVSVPKYRQTKEKVYIFAEDEPDENWVKYKDKDDVFVSRSGKIKKIDKKGNVTVTYGCFNNYGYLHVGNNGVHRMVADTFIPNPDNKPEINHIDGNPANNKVENLEWCNRRENMISPDTHDRISRKIACVDVETKEIVKEYISIRDAVREIKGSFYSLKDACEAGNKKYKGYYWKFI